MRLPSRAKVQHPPIHSGFVQLQLHIYNTSFQQSGRSSASGREGFYPFGKHVSPPTTSDRYHTLPILRLICTSVFFTHPLLLRNTIPKGAFLFVMVGRLLQLPVNPLGAERPSPALTLLFVRFRSCVVPLPSFLPFHPRSLPFVPLCEPIAANSRPPHTPPLIMPSPPISARHGIMGAVCGVVWCGRVRVMRV